MERDRLHCRPHASRLGGRGGMSRFALRRRSHMIRSFPVRTLSALAFAMILPVAAFAAHSTEAKATTVHAAHVAHAKRMPAVDINSASKEDLMKLSGITD